MSTKVNNTAIEAMERDELITKLRNSGYGDLIDLLLENDSKVYTKKGRLNKSGACRVLGWKNKQLEVALLACKEVLRREFD